MRIRRRKRTQAGVTLIEMLVVVTIIALFAALVLPRMMGQADKAKRTAARTQIAQYLTALGQRTSWTRAFIPPRSKVKALRTEAGKRE
jgi:general secretion pathway protein G